MSKLDPRIEAIRKEYGLIVSAILGTLTILAFAVAVLIKIGAI